MQSGIFALSKVSPLYKGNDQHPLPLTCFRHKWHIQTLSLCISTHTQTYSCTPSLITLLLPWMLNLLYSMRFGPHSPLCSTLKIVISIIVGCQLLALTPTATKRRHCEYSPLCTTIPVTLTNHSKLYPVSISYRFWQTRVNLVIT